MTWMLYLYDAGGNAVGQANHFEGSFSTDPEYEQSDELLAALADRPELDDPVSASNSFESEDGLAYPVWDTEVAPIDDPELALDRVGSAVVAAGLAASYELADE